MGSSDDSIALVWHNGQLLHEDQVRLSPFDQGLTIGLGAFETLVAVHGRPFAFSRHWDRLVRSCHGLGLPIPDKQAVAAALPAVAAANHHPDGRLRITVTPGPGPLGSDRAKSPAANCLIVAAPRPLWPARSSVITVPWPRNEHSPLAGLKSTSYAENSLALAEARRHGADEALFFNTAGHLCEGTGSNVFVVVDGTLTTPPLSDGCLPGVTRALVVELAHATGLPLNETSLTREHLALATEAFLTSTTRDIQPIATLNTQSLPAAPGPLTTQLIAAWKARFPLPDIDP